MSKQDAAGVDYGNLDAFKVNAMRAAKRTAEFVVRKGWKELSWTRGESAYVMRRNSDGLYLATVIEGLGTKNLIAENLELSRMYDSLHAVIAWDNVAMIMNDLITVGALPLVCMLHPALAEGDHLAGRRGDDLIEGTASALAECGAVWGPGETPELSGIIQPGTMCLSGAGVGIVSDGQFLINPANIRAGMRIVLLGSSGIHANGLSRARKIASQLRLGYLATLPSGETFGKALLTPTRLYVPFMEACQREKLNIAYAINMTGHGWRKIMRARQPFTYCIERVPKPQEVFGFMQQHGGISHEEAYQAFNMGAGFALIVAADDVPRLQSIALSLNVPMLDAGYVEDGPRRVIIEPLELAFDELSIR